MVKQYAIGQYDADGNFVHLLQAFKGGEGFNSVWTEDEIEFERSLKVYREISDQIGWSAEGFTREVTQPKRIGN